MRIGLIAVSAMGSGDKNLSALGRSLPYFAARWDAIGALPSLALLTLAGMTPRHHTVDYRQISSADALDLNALSYDLVGISSYTAQIFTAYELAERIRQRGIPVVIGGPHVSLLPDEAQEHADAIVIGEGEMVWDRLLADAERGALKPRYGNLEASFDLANAPMPAYQLLDLSRFNRLPVQSSRGCPHRCEFCASSVLLSGKYKLKPHEKVLAEMDTVCSLWKRPFIEFVNDNTFVHKKYWKALLPEIQKRRIRWFAEADISIAYDEDLLRAMYASGCVQVLIGIESPSEEDLDGVDSRGNWKKKQASRFVDAVKTIQEHGITVLGCFVLGMDTQGPDAFDRIYDFVKQTELFDVQITIETPFPGTPLYDRVKSEGRLLADDNWSKYTLFDVVFQPKRMSIEQLREGFLKLGLKVFDEKFVQWRRQQFKEKLRRLYRSRPRDVHEV